MPHSEVYTHTVTIRMAHTDAAGMVYFARVFDLAADAYEALLESRGLPVGQLVREGAYAIPFVHAEADYHAPMRLGERISIAVRVEKLGRCSFALGFTLTRNGGERCATVRSVHATVDRGAGRPVPLPGELCKALEGG